MAARAFKVRSPANLGLTRLLPAFSPRLLPVPSLSGSRAFSVWVFRQTAPRQSRTVPRITKPSLHCYTSSHLVYRNSAAYRGIASAHFMYNFTQPSYPSVASGPVLSSHDIDLKLRQEPREALVTTEGKEKARKPVDPPPIIQLSVRPTADPSQHFLQSPYLFMCTSLYKPDKDEAWEGNGNKSLAGSLVSSLHRLKDTNNKDGGFFVFGDISVKVQGTFRLHFSLFDLRKDSHDVVYLGSITSEPFRVLLPKDFKGMDESTYLSRAFSDQGVRLRLRKEPRAMMGGNKRPYSYTVGDSGQSNAPLAARPNTNIDAYSYQDDLSQSPAKRYRPSGDLDENERKDHYPDHSTAGFPSTYGNSQYPVRQPSYSGMSTLAGQAMTPYPSFGAYTAGGTPPYPFRPNIGGASSYISDSLLPTTGAGAMSSQSRFPEYNPAPMSQMFTPYSQQRGLPASLTFGEESSSGLGAYRTSSTAGIGDNRPSTATGVPPTMSQHTPHSQHSSHPSHDSMTSSRGPTLSQSPQLLRPSYSVPDHSFGSQIPASNRPVGRYEERVAIAQSQYPNQRNHFQVPTTDRDLTSHTDTGAIPPLLSFPPDSDAKDNTGTGQPTCQPT